MKSNEELITSLLEVLKETDYIHMEQLPSIDLYMDQVTTFMDRYLASGKRHEDDKLLTKTMINNYTKNKILPSPNKKKYSADHMVQLIFIYYLKGFLSISDINTLLTPLSDQYFGDEKDSLLDIYSKIFEAVLPAQIDHLADSLMEDYKKSTEIFLDYPEKDRQYLQLFSLVSFLSLDVYMKKRIVETIIDEMKKDEE